MTIDLPASNEPVAGSLRWVARIAGGTSLLAAGVLLVVVFWIGDSGGTSYYEVVRAQVLTHRQLGPALLVGGLVLLILVATLTWLVALYGSFRIAGPLYRFACNLRQTGERPPQRIRRDDALQATSDHLQRAWHELHHLQRELGQAVQAAEAARAADDPDAWAQATSRLRALIHRVQLDG
ncbi:MAG TPA: hypothetical protein ENK53_03450 [Thiotrichales bacterium]|nr:hypothetical protein [Thiotrichales bacterium]